MNRKLLIVPLLAAFVIFATGALAVAQGMDALKQSFKDRLPKLTEFKTAGKLGETWDGKVAVVKDEFASDAEVKKTMDSENADRKMLYAAMANQVGATPDKVALQNGERNAKNAKAGEYLKGKDGASAFFVARLRRSAGAEG